MLDGTEEYCKVHGEPLHIWVVRFLSEKLKHFSFKLEKYMLKLLLLCLRDAHMHTPNNFGTTQSNTEMIFRHCQQQQSSLDSDTVSLHLMAS